MDNVTIVAIPEKDQPIWKISSEKVPHVTLLSLGELGSNFDIPRMIDYVAHTAKMSMHRFGLSVDRRGVLGPQDADVLFFDKSEWNIGMLVRARSHMLADPHILTAYKSVPQFPSWVPHLTLGYPTSPAKVVPENDFALSWIKFDKVAVWTGDYEGAEFLLEREDRAAELVMSDKVDNILAHFGVKGMKWGVRNVDIKAASDPLPATKTSRGETVNFSPNKATLLARGLAHLSSRFRDRLNRSDSYNIQNGKGEKVGELDLLKESHTSLNIVWVGVPDKHRGKGYATAATKAAVDHAKRKKMKQVTLEVPGKAPDARHIYEKLGFKVDKVQSDKSSTPENDPYWGGLTSMTLKLNSAKHEDDSEFLKHFGVKGMKWGVRRSTSSSSPGSEDHQRAAAVKQKARSGGGTKALSNKDLQDAITRMNLERQYHTLTPSKKKQAAKFVSEILLGVGKQQATKLASDFAAQQVAGLLKK